MEKGIKEGELKSKIEDVISLVSDANMTLDKSMQILKVDVCFKEQIENELKKRGIKYDE